MHSNREEAIGLLDGTASPVEFEKEHYEPQVESKKNTATRWVTFLLFAFIALDVAIFGYVAKQLFYEDYSEELEIRNAYYGLDELYDPQWNLANSSHHDPIINLPRRLGMVDSSNPKKISPFEEHLTLTPYGRMSIPDHHLQVSDNMHMIYQFRVIDYGMDECQLALRLPELDDSKLLDPYVFRGDNNQALLDVCELDAPKLIDIPKLSWSSRPSCKQHVGTFDARPGIERTLAKFPCETATVRSFQLSCAPQNRDCFIDVWSSQNQTWGVFMYQHQTV
ncbi:hypothetical protein BDY19DRAFT_993202 [Irpex rosettiformis]|uniref:Uncharacterized protein n=1 Tax=Irpex rosettiformis TaxID=378272 RepID=A0ACB8U643_9APHY|nr:hypothetical protein BDY19DRAFT_993202 [Irpex rosettiformis]